MKVAETARLSLRQLALSDAAFMCRLLNEPSWLLNIGDRGVRTPADAERYIETTALQMYQRLGFGMYLLESKPDAEPIGLCGLVKRDSLPDADLGFALLPEFWGQGYAFEASAAVMAHARTAFGLSRLLAIVTPTNQPSIKLLEKLGFRFQQMIRTISTGENLKLYAATT